MAKKNDGGVAVLDKGGNGEVTGEKARDGGLAIKVPTGVDPRVIKADPRQNISRWLAEEQVDDDYIRGLGLDMSKRGNSNPVKVMRLKGDPKFELDLVAGFNRHAAALLILKGYDVLDPETGETVRVHNPEFKLKVQVVTGNELDRARENIGENSYRKELTAMDYAGQVRYCKEVLALNTGETARLMNINPSYVSQYEKLLALPVKIQMPLAKGLIKPSIRVLMKLTEMAPEDREPYFERILENDRVTLDDVRAAIVEKHAERHDQPADPKDQDGTDGGDTDTGESSKGSKSGPTMQMTPRLLRKFYESRMGPAEFPAVSTYCKFMLDRRMPGKATDAQHENALYKLAAMSARALFDHLLADGKLADGVTEDDFKALWKQVSNVNADAKD